MRLRDAALLPGCAAVLTLLTGLLLILLLLMLGLLSAVLPSARIVLLRALSVLRALLLSCHLVKPPGVSPNWLGSDCRFCVARKFQEFLRHNAGLLHFLKKP